MIDILLYFLLILCFVIGIYWKFKTSPHKTVKFSNTKEQEVREARAKEIRETRKAGKFN
ncbi:MAG: hypothetical protein KDK45_00090 [Leptospiraceae bacterium]|nr:hypothetical protein [Leptospiraceae bacterium]